MVFWSDSLAVASVDNSSRGTVLGLLVIPVSLMLGFLLNTIVWLIVNSVFRKIVRNNLGPSEKEALAKLEKFTESIADHFQIQKTKQSWNPHLPSLLLPSLDTQKVGHLHQSYFSWYEFPINSALAILFFAVSYYSVAKLLSNRWKLSMCNALLFLVAGPNIIFILVAVLTFVMVYSAYKNLKRYEERAIWLMLGTLYEAQTKQLNEKRSSCGQPSGAVAGAPAADAEPNVRSTT